MDLSLLLPRLAPSLPVPRGTSSARKLPRAMSLLALSSITGMALAG